MRADSLLKHNIDAILKARGQTRHDLAVWARQSTDRKKVDPWISGIFTRPNREFQFKYLDRIADFFGLAVYQLFQPGISPLTERRAGHERRNGQDRRISARRGDLPSSPIRQIAVTPEDEEVLAELHALDYETYQRVKGWITVAKIGVGSGRKIPPPEGSPSGAAGGSRRSPRSKGTRRMTRTPPTPK